MDVCFFLMNLVGGLFTIGAAENNALPKHDPVVLLHPDYEKVFLDGAELGDGNKRRIKLSLASGPELCLPTGKIIACDPGYVTLASYERSVKPGSYPVSFSYGKSPTDTGKVLVCAKVQFSKEKVVQWELATLPGQKIQNLKKGEIYGFSVDTGLACFMDSSVSAIMGKQETYDNLLKTLDQDHPKPLMLDHVSKANVIAFRSGIGDGFYSAWWGLDKDRAPTALVVDFGMLTYEESDEVIIDKPADFLEKELKNDQLKGAGLAVFMGEHSFWDEGKYLKGQQLIITGVYRYSLCAELVGTAGKVIDKSENYGSGSGTYNEQPCNFKWLAATKEDLSKHRLRLVFTKGKKVLNWIAP